MILPLTFRCLPGRFLLVFWAFCFFTFEVSANANTDFSKRFGELINEKRFPEAIEAVHLRFPVKRDIKLFNLALVKVHAGDGNEALSYLSQIKYPQKFSGFVLLKSYAYYLESEFLEVKNLLQENEKKLEENQKLANLYLKSLFELADYKTGVDFLNATAVFDKHQKQFHIWNLLFYNGVGDCKNAAAHAMEIYNMQQNLSFYKLGLLSLACAKEWVLIQHYTENKSMLNVNDTIAFIHWLSIDQFQEKKSRNNDEAFHSYIKHKQNPQRIFLLILHFLFQQWLYLLLLGFLIIWYFFLSPKKNKP